MAAYASAGQLDQLIAQFGPLSASTKPTDTQAADMLANIAGEIEVCLAAAGVSVPVTAADHGQTYLDWIELLNAEGAAVLVLKSMFPDAGGPGNVPWTVFDQNYVRGLKGIKDGTMVPPSAPKSAGHVAPTTYFNRNPDEEEDLGDISEPFFTRGKVY